MCLLTVVACAVFGGDGLAFDDGGAWVFVQHLRDIGDGFLHVLLRLLDLLVVIGPRRNIVTIILSSPTNTYFVHVSQHGIVTRGLDGHDE